MTELRTRERGPFRILIEGNDDPKDRNQYFRIDIYAPREPTGIRREIVYVHDSRIAFNNAVRAYGKRLLNITNLETGRLVAGGK